MTKSCPLFPSQHHFYNQKSTDFVFVLLFHWRAAISHPRKQMYLLQIRTQLLKSQWFYPEMLDYHQRNSGGADTWNMIRKVQLMLTPQRLKWSSRQSLPLISTTSSSYSSLFWARKIKEMALPIWKHRETFWAVSPEPVDVFIWLLQ